MNGTLLSAAIRGARASALAVVIGLGGVGSATAQSLLSPTINGSNPIGTNNLGGSVNGASGTNPSGFTGLGLNQDVTFDFSALLQDTNTGVGPTPQWNSGLSFNSTTELQVQANNTSISQGGSVSYAFDFSDDIWGFTFGMNGFDNGDYSEIRAFRDGVPVPLDDSMFTSNGTNVNVSDNGLGVLIVEGPGNNDAQEFYTVALPLDVIIDQILFSPTGKSATSAPGNNANVTLQYNGIGWARPGISLVKSSVLNDGGDGFADAGDTITYTYVATNTGRVPLQNVVLVEETFTGNNGTPSPAFDIGSGGATPANMPVGETLTYTATYTLDAADIAAGTVFNRAEVTGLPLGGTIGADEVSDLSDSSNPGDGGAVGSPDEDDQTSTDLPARPAPIATSPGPTPPLSCQAPSDYETVLFTGAGTGASTNVQVTQTSPAPMTFGASNPDPLIFDGPEFATNNPQSNRVNGGVTNANLAGLAVDLTQTFSSIAVDGTAYVMDYFVHINSLDQLAFVVDLAANPNVGVTVVSASDDTGLATVSGLDYIVDVLEADRDMSVANEQLNGDAGFSADFTVRVFSTAPGVPISSVTLGFIEDPIRDLAATEGFQLAYELCVGIPRIELVKSVTSIDDTNLNGTFGDAGDTVNYAFTVTNTGDLPLTNIAVTDATATLSGSVAPLNPGDADATSVTGARVITAGDVTAGFVENTATVTADVADDTGAPVTTGTDGASPVTPVSDVSDAGTEPVLTNADDPVLIADPAAVETPQGNGSTDADPTNDPTVVTIPANPSRPAVSGTVFLDSDLDGVFDDGVEPGLDGYRVVLRDGAGNTIAETTTDVDGMYEFIAFPPGNDYSIAFFDPDTGDFLDEITGLDFGLSTLLTDQNLPVPPPGTRPAVTGLVFLDNNRDGDFDDGVDGRLDGYRVVLRDSDGTIIAETVTGADGTYSLAGFPPGEDYVLEFNDPDTGDVIGSIDGLDFAFDTLLSDQNLPIVGGVAESTVVLTKTTPLDTVIVGQSVPFTVTVENTGAVDLSQLDVVDTLPPGLVYTPGSATINGVPVEPIIDGNRLIWPDLSIAAGETIEIEFRTRVTSQAQPGTLTATAVTLDGVTSDPVSNDGSASVRLLPEAVFDCGDVIGKVFDDRNMNGYQDPVAGENRALITDQAIFDGKLGGKLTPPPEPRGEPGIPGVRVVTQTGTIITTDEYGRFNVPCAELPGAMGANFSLKIDERSLPTGYRLTTENPRTMRLTAGIMTEMNFGAAIGRVVNVDLTAAAFDPGTTEPSDRLEQGLDRLLTQVSTTPSVLRLSYFHSGEDEAAMRARLRAVEDYIEAEWAGIGAYRLIVERTIKRLQ